MASSPKAFVTGRRAIIEALYALGEEAPAIAEAAAVDGVKTFEIAIFQRAPVDSGDTKKRIKTTVKRTASKVEAAVNTPPQAVFTEYGFMHKRSGKRIAAQPWIRPGFDSKVDEVEKTALQEIAKGIEASAKRNAGDENADS
jgi:hypothetical protein